MAAGAGENTGVYKIVYDCAHRSDGYARPRNNTSIGQEDTPMKKTNTARYVSKTLSESPLGCYEVDEELEEKMRQSAKSKMTKAEVRAQRISWVYGNLPRACGLTIEDVAKILDEQEGV